jgi:O-antigen ligase
MAIMILVLCFIGMILVFIPTDLNILGTRFDSDDGRLFIWAYYLNLIVRNPLGFGLGFDSIVDTNIGLEGLRLPPHNAILQAGMYAGYIGIGVSLYLILKVFGIICQIKQEMKTINPPLNIIGIILAWISLVVNQMFSGFLSEDFNFSILTALLLVKFMQLSSNPSKN